MVSKLKRETTKRIGAEIKVDIIIPTLNEAGTIGKLLFNISQLRLPVTLSPLVIDGGSDDDTISICGKTNTRVLRQKGKGKGRERGC